MKYVFVIIPGFFCAVASMAQATHKVEADKIVGIVGDKIILQSDVNNDILDRRRLGEPIAENANCSIMEQQLILKALILQAEKDSIVIDNDDLEAALDNRIRAFIKMYKSEQAVREISGRTIYQLKEDFRQPIKERMMAERLSQQITASVKITPQEVKEYFTKKEPASLPFYDMHIELGEIVVYPHASPELEKLAIDELNDYKHLVESGQQKFAILAQLYSDDKYTKDQGGELTINRTDKGAGPAFIDRAFIGQVFRLKEGQVSPVFKSKFGYHIVQLVNRTGDDVTIRHIMRMPKITGKEMNEGIVKLDSVRAQLIAGTTTFGAAVAKYSESDTRLTGGIRLNAEGMSWLSLSQLDKDLQLLLGQTQLKPGAFSTPTPFRDSEGKQGVRILYLKSRSLPHRQNIQDDYARIAEEALTLKKQQAVENWFATKIPSYYVMIDPAFNTCGTLSNWLRYAVSGK